VVAVKAAGQRIELTPSADLGRARRNFLFANTILFLLGVTNPGTVALPGFDKLAPLPGPLAITFVAIASLLFWWEYWNEYRITTIRNNAMFAGDGIDRVETALEILRSSNGALAERFEAAAYQVINEIRDVTTPKTILGPPDGAVAESLDSVLRRLHELKPSPGTMAAIVQGAEEDFLRRVNNYRAEMLRLQDVAAANLEGVPALKDMIAEASARARDLAEGIESVSSRVHQFQRSAFFWKDLVGPACYFGAALSIAGSRLLLKALVERSLGDPDLLGWTAGLLGGSLGLIYVLTRNLRLMREGLSTRLSQAGLKPRG